MSLGLNILLIFVFLVIGSVFSGTELALVSLRGSQIEQMEQEDARGAKVAKIARDPNTFLSTVQIGVTLSGFLSASFGASSIAPYLIPVVESWGVHPGIAGGLVNIILTLIIRLILTPLQTKSVKSTANMQIMQPKIAEIQEKYADDPVRMQEEQMKLYSEASFNPLMGCLPLFLQMPIFFALFTVVRNVPVDASFFGILPSISDSVAGVLAASGWAAAAPYIIFDLLFGVLTFVPMLMNTQMQGDQRMQSITMGAVMSIMMLWFGWSCPAAVLLYYVTSSLWQVAQQQLVTNKVMEKARKEAEEAAKNKPVEVNVVRKEKKPRPHKKN